jgi:hypothetical protein
MALTQILDQDSQDVLLTLDVTRVYTIEGDVDITEHPVEQGANISDHIRPKPRIITIEGLISNTPILSVEESGFATYLPDEPGPAAAAYAMLENRRRGGFLHTLVLPLDTIQALALKRVSQPKDRTTGDALRFSLTFQEIVIVTNSTTVVATATPQTQGTRNKGTDTTTSATPTEDQNDAARTVSNALGITSSS